MADDFRLSFLCTELEAAGLLGAAAAGFLLPFLSGPPGAITTTGDGFVWTKSLLNGEEGSTFSMGKLGVLKVDHGVISVSVGMSTRGGSTEIRMLFSLLGNRAVTLEIDRDVAAVANRMTRTLPGGTKELVGYDRANLQTLSIPLPSAAIEWTFRPGEEGQISSTVQFYQSLDLVGDAVAGVVRFPLAADKVVVLPKVLGVAFGAEDLFIDFSDTAGAADFVTRFPEIYVPSWKGIGAKAARILVPLADDDFAILSAEGFLIGFDGGFSGKVSGAWTNTGTGRFRELRAEVDLRENHFVRGELSCTVDFQQLLKSVAQDGSAVSTEGTDSAQKALAARVTNQYGQIDTSAISLDGHLRLTGGLTRTTVGTDEVFGVDFVMESLAGANGQPVTALTGLAARLPLWLLGLGAGVPAFIDGVRKEEAGKMLAGLAMAYFALVDMGAYASPGDTSLFPVLEQLSFPRLGFRYIHVTSPEHDDRYYELLADVRLRWSLGSSIMDLVNILATATARGGAASTNLFGAGMDSIHIGGPLEIEIANLALRLKRSASGTEVMPALSEELRRLFEERDIAITARNLPEIQITQGGEDGNPPKVVAGAKFVKSGDGTTTRYGLSIQLSGLGGASFSVNQSAVGVIFYFWPDFDVELAQQLLQQPKMQFMVPPVCYAEGTLELDKPFASGAGVQNRITVDVGLYNDKVKPGTKITKDNLKDLVLLKNYKYQFGGELAWGEAHGPAPAQKPFDFLFAEVHYEGKTPLFCLGAVGVYGLGGLFGRNIAPGAPNGDESALGIANWIQGAGDGAFSNVRDWPAAGPTLATWHPDRHWATSPAQDDKDKWAVGLTIKAGSPGDGGKTYMVDALLLAGFPELWLALAGFAVVKPINAKLAVVIVYDHPSRSFVIKAVAEYKVDKANGRIVTSKAKFELGSTSNPRRGWFNLGHYREQSGGPSQARLLSTFNTKFYFVFDTNRLDAFGLVPHESVKRPSIAGPAVGAGVMWQLGPKKYGPSWLHIELFGALGFNVAVSFNPFTIYGDIYAVGHIKLKVFVFSGKLSLAARLYGLATAHAARFAGEIAVKIGMPWPFDDIDESVDFVLEVGSPTLSKPELECNATALARLESRSAPLPPDNAVRMPIDGIVALQLNKPIFDLRPAAPGTTSLVVNDYLHGSPGAPVPPAADKLKEVIETEFVGEKYQLTYTHVLDRLVVRRRKGNGPWTVVPELAAAWEVPLSSSAQADMEVTEPHHVLYLNTFLAPELQFSADALQSFYDVHADTVFLPPCAVPARVCLLYPEVAQHPPLPPVDQSGADYRLTFSTPLGTVTMQEISHPTQGYGGLPVNDDRLAWHSGELDLPESASLSLPDAGAVDLTLRLTGAPTNTDVIDHYAVDVEVELGGAAPMQLRAILRPNASTPCQMKVEADHPLLDYDLLKVEVIAEKCEAPGTLIFRFELLAASVEHPIAGITVSGPFVELRPGVLESGADSKEALESVLAAIRDGMVLRAYQICFERQSGAQGAWQSTQIGGTSGPGSQGPLALWNNMLLEPDSEYEVSFKVVSTGSSKLIGHDEDRAPSEHVPWTQSTGDTPAFRTIRFRTEAQPSQDVKRYVGFTYPAPATPAEGEPARYPTPLYRDHLTPFLTLKNRGLIRQIYAKHHGADTLVTRLVDLAGEPVPAQQTGHFSIGSTPTDEALEDLASHCLPYAQEFTRVDFALWETQLALDSAYSLELFDTSSAPGRVVFSSGFRTSRFASFVEHVDHVNSLFAGAPELPVLDDASAAATLSAIVGAVIAGNAPGHDDAVDAVYARLLGARSARLGDLRGGAGGDFGARLVGGAATDRHVWGIAIELDEPLVGKDGVTLQGAVSGAGRPDAGVIVCGTGPERLVVLRDRSGSRLLLFRSEDGINFAPFPSAAKLPLRFSGEGPLRASIQSYVDAVFLHLGPAQRAAEVDKVVNQIRTMSAFSRVLQSTPALVSIPLV